MTKEFLQNLECDRCGACCRTLPIYASQGDAEREPKIKAEALELKPWLATGGWDYRLFPLPFQSTCPFLCQNSLCRVYQTRPEVCRRFEAGSTQCQEARVLAGLPPLALEIGSDTQRLESISELKQG